MNGKSLVDKYAPLRAVETKAQPAPENDTPDDLGAFGFLRGTRDRAIMLEIHHRDGTISALGYAWLDHAIFDPSEGITLFFGRRKVVIQGQHLDAEVRPMIQLFPAILRHRVPWIQEARGPESLQASPGALVIEDITVES